MDQPKNTIIESIGVYLPPNAVSTGEILQGCNKQIHFPLEKITGIKSRPMAGESEFSIDLARHAIADCLDASKYKPGDINMLVCCNISRYDAPNQIAFEPGTSVKLRKEFGFEQALAFDITNACAGMFTGIYIVNAFINAGIANTGMVVSGEYITHLTKIAQRDIESFMDNRLACLTLGDAGAAIILEKGTDIRVGFQEFELQTFGRYSPYCVAKPSGRGGMIMHTDAINLSDVAVKSGVNHAIETLRRAGWPGDSFHHLIMHQTSELTLNSARREINRAMNAEICNDRNMIRNLAARGNTASTSHFVALADQIRSKQINSGDRVVFSISASGLTTGTALYVFDDLPERIQQKGAAASKSQNPMIPYINGQTLKNQVPRVRIASSGTQRGSEKGNSDSMELLVTAAEKCLEKSGFRSADIDLLIYSGVYRTDYIMEPAYASFLAGRLDMNAITTSDPDAKKSLAFDIFNGAMGFLNACYVAQGMMAAGVCQTAMVAAAEVENNAGFFRDDLLGLQEAGSAIILQPGSLHDSGFSRFLFRYADESIQAYTTYSDTRGENLYLNITKDHGLESLYLACIVPAVMEILEQEHLQWSDVSLVFPPQISPGFISALGEKLGVAPERLVNALDGGPDLFTSSVPFAWEYAIENNLAKPGDIGLVISVGSGLQAGCAIYHF